MLVIWDSNFIAREWKKDSKEENRSKNFQRLRPTLTVIYILYLVKKICLDFNVLN